jgi:hypothetical protein
MSRSGLMADAVTLAFVVAMAGAGCATNTLWEEQRYHPAAQLDLRLAQGPDHRDVLVQYNEQREEEKKTRRRAYWLFAFTNSIANEGRPIFVNPKNSAALTPVPLLLEATATNAPAAAGYVAVATPAQQGFDLWLEGVWLGRYDLPIYYAKPRASIWRVAATPFAALGDATVVVVVCAAVVAVVVGVLYAESESQ